MARTEWSLPKLLDDHILVRQVTGPECHGAPPRRPFRELLADDAVAAQAVAGMEGGTVVTPPISNPTS